MRARIWRSVSRCVAAWFSVVCSVLQHRVLQCAAVCRSVCMRAGEGRHGSGAVCCSVLQCVAVCCNVFQCVAVWCSVWQCVACGRVIAGTDLKNWVEMCCSMLQCAAVSCIVL